MSTSIPEPAKITIVVDVKEGKTVEGVKLLQEMLDTEFGPQMRARVRQIVKDNFDVFFPEESE